MSKDPKTKGEITEARVIAHLVENGVEVYPSFGDNYAGDVVVDLGCLKKVQIKRGRFRDGCVLFNASRTGMNSQEYKFEGYGDEVDAFISHCEELDEYYWVDNEDICSTTMRLRVEEPKQRKSNINWASNYKLEDEL